MKRGMGRKRSSSAAEAAEGSEAGAAASNAAAAEPAAEGPAAGKPAVDAISESAAETAAETFSRKAGYLKEHHRFFHLRDTAGQERDFHFHDFDKIVILLSGRVDYAVENELYTLHPWEILLVRHHTIHKAIIDKTVPYERIIVYLNEDYYASVLPETDLTNCFAEADGSLRRLLLPGRERLTEIREVLGRYEKQAAESGPLSAALCETLLMQLLLLLRMVTGDGTTGSPRRYEKKIEQTLSYIDSHLTSPLTVEEIASEAYLSKYHFMRLFRESTGTTVHAYVRQRRLLNAAQLIREGVSAAEAAEKSGFEDYTVFYRAFRKSFGVTPSEFKK